MLVLETERESARRRIESEARRIRRTLEHVDRCIEDGSTLNDLGELQAASSAYEASVGAYARMTDVIRRYESRQR